MAKVLLVDTNFSSVPIHRELISMGHEVHVVGNNPADCLAKISPNYWHLDYADLGSLRALIDQQGYAYLVPGCTDRSYLSCAAVSDGRFPGLDSPDACEPVFNKRAFRKLAERIDLPAPERIATNSPPRHFPIIVKPVDAFSGKGITVLRDADGLAFDEAIAKARAASHNGECVVEAYVEGQLYSHSAFIRDGRVTVDFLVREDSTANAFVVDTSRVVDDPADVVACLRDCVERMAAELGLVDGLLHTQFIRGNTGIQLIETTRRCPGDLYSQLIELTTGYPYARAYVMPFLGEQVDAALGARHRDPIMRHTVTLKAAQSFAYLRFKSALHTEHWTPISLRGDLLKPSPQGLIGILFCRGADAQDLDRIYQATLRRDLYEVLS
jgi:hypothetical protein